MLPDLGEKGYLFPVFPRGGERSEGAKIVHVRFVAPSAVDSDSAVVQTENR